MCSNDPVFEEVFPNYVVTLLFITIAVEHDFYLENLNY